MTSTSASSAGDRDEQATAPRVTAGGTRASPDLGGLAAQVAQVVELGAPDVTTGDDLDLLTIGCARGRSA